MSEAELQTAVLKWLKLYKIFAWRMPVGPVVHRRGIGGSVKEVWKPSPIKGFPDIAGVLTKSHPGKFFVIELKSGTGKLRPEQKDWISSLQTAGACVAVVRSLDGLQQVMRQWGEIS